jgi:hypothetical protein
VVDLSSPLDEEEHIHDTARDFEFAQHMFGKLNRDLLGPLGDDKVIILSDSDKEKEEAHEEKSASVEDAATSAAVNSVSTASTDDIDTPAEKSLTLAASPVDADNDCRRPELLPTCHRIPGGPKESGSRSGGYPLLFLCYFNPLNTLQ